MMTVPNPQRISPHMARKGRRLHEQGRVHRIPGSWVALVEGDTLDAAGEHVLYAVPMNADDQPLGCTCPHHGPCSHPQAAILEARNPTTPTGDRP